MTLKGPSLSVAFLAALDELPLPATRDELYEVMRVVDGTEFEEKLAAALEIIGTIREEKPPVERQPGTLELGIGRWQFSALDAAMRSLRFIAAEAAALAAAGVSHATVLLAVVNLILASPELLAVEKLSDEELKILLELKTRGPRSVADLENETKVADIPSVLDQLSGKSLISEQQGMYRARF